MKYRKQVEINGNTVYASVYREDGERVQFKIFSGDFTFKTLEQRAKIAHKWCEDKIEFHNEHEVVITTNYGSTMSPEPL